MAKNVLTDNFLAPLDGATSAKVDINAGIGNLTIGQLNGGEQVLASGTLEYLEGQGVPNQSAITSNGRATLTLRKGEAGRPRFRFPWDACGAAYDWLIHLNPAVSCDIAAHTDGGNLKLNLAGLAVTRVAAESGGGNLEVVLPNQAANLSVAAQTGGGNVTVEMGTGTTGSSTVSATSGAGNVAVRVPRGIAARIQATSGLGKVIVDPGFSKINKNTYQSADYDRAANKVEITLKTGAGNASVSTK